MSWEKWNSDRRLSWVVMAQVGHSLLQFSCYILWIAITNELTIWGLVLETVSTRMNHFCLVFPSRVRWNIERINQLEGIKRTRRVRVGATDWLSRRHRLIAKDRSWLISTEETSHAVEMSRLLKWSRCVCHPSLKESRCCKSTRIKTLIEIRQSSSI